jgi:hypothetical protein
LLFNLIELGNNSELNQPWEKNQKKKRKKKTEEEKNGGAVC